MVGRVTEGETFRCPFCGLEINVHVNAGINIRSRSLAYQKLKKDIELRSTPATGGRACLRCPDKESMIQEVSSDKDEQSIENTSIQAAPFNKLAQLAVNRLVNSPINRTQ